MKIVFLHGLISATALLVSNVLAQDIPSPNDLGPPVASIVTTFEELNLKNLTIDLNVAQPASAPGVLSSAPPLTQMQVFAVGSSYCGWEYPASGASSTSCDHGGSQLRAAILEIGYGSNPIAWMIGGLLPTSANYLTELLCQQPGGGINYCSSGQTVVGFLRYYNLDGHQSGIFAYQNTSTNSPWNTMSRSIYIQ